MRQTEDEEMSSYHWEVHNNKKQKVSTFGASVTASYSQLKYKEIKKHSSTRNEMHANNTRLTFTVREGHFYCVNGYNCTYYHSYKKYVEQLEIISRTIKAQSVLRGIMALIQSLRSELGITSGIRQGRKLTP